MAEIINLREKYIKSIEEKAYERLRAFPVDETGEIYAIPTNATNTFNIEESFKKAMFLRNTEVIEAIKNFEVKFGDGIMVGVNEWDEDGNVVIGITNGPESPGFMSIRVNSEMDDEHREMLINMIAYYHKDKEVAVIFLVHYTFEDIEKLLKSDDEYYIPEILR